MSNVAFVCVNCRIAQKVDSSLLNAVVRCGSCSTVVRVPDKAPPVQDNEVRRSPPEPEEASRIVDSTGRIMLENIEKPEVFEGYLESSAGSRPLRKEMIGPLALVVIWSLASFAILSGALNVYLVLRLRAMDEALKSKKPFGVFMREEETGRINIRENLS